MKWDSVFPQICKSMFRITATYEGGSVSATGFMVAKYKQPDKLAFAMATAEHVFRPLPMYADVQWSVERYNWKAEKTGSHSFKSNIQKMGGSPIRANLVSDVGLLFLPKLEFEVEPVRVLNHNYAITPGAKVGWAGFPEFVTKKTTRPHPCYFEGVVSSVVDRVETESKLFYLVDGHGGRGVSGGPLWCWNDVLGNYEVIGICSHYLFGDQKADKKSASNPEFILQGPGLVVFESINPVIGYLQTSKELDINIAN